MLRRFRKLRDHALQATDGEIGSITDLYFDDVAWDIRYLVVDVSDWLSGRSVLIVPRVAEAPAGESGAIPVRLNKEQIRMSPDVGTHKPVSRQHEEALHAHYGWPPYWMGDTITGAGMSNWIHPVLSGSAAPPETSAEAGAEAVSMESEDGDPHLRSANELDGYRIHSRTGEIGSVEDLIVDDEAWRLRYMMAKTGGWFSGKRVLIAVPWIVEISWTESSVHVDLEREAIADAPEFDSAAPLRRDYEERLHAHYSRSRYWDPAGPPGRGLPNE
jgi:uncharacterized protein YrrD